MNIRKVLFLLLLLVTGITSAQTSVEFICGDPKGNNDLMLIPEAELYQSGVLVEVIGFSFDPTETIDSLKPGNYTLIYTSFFGDTVNQPITILNTTLQQVKLDVMFMSESKRNTELMINHLRNGQSLLIELETHGCRTIMGCNEIEFSKHRGNYYVVFNEKKQRLTDEQLAVVRQFELELRNIPKYSCSIKHTYSLTLGKEKLEFYDRSCRWFGLDQLLEDLGLKPVEDVKK